MQNLKQRRQVRFQQRTTSYERKNLNQLTTNEISSTMKSYKQLTSTGTQQTFTNGNGGPLQIGQNVQKIAPANNFWAWGKDSSVKMYSTKEFYEFATFNHVAQEEKDKLKLVGSMKIIDQVNPEIRYQHKPGSVIFRQTVQSYPISGAEASNFVKERMLTSTCVEGQLSRPIEYSTQYQSGLRNKSNRNEWIQQEIERPNYFKFYNNTSQLYRNLGPEEDPLMKKTICVPACWVLWALIGLFGALFGIIFGLGLISGVGLKGFDLTVPPQSPVVPVIPSIPQIPTNITQTTDKVVPVVVPPIFEGQNFIDPERINPIRIQTTTVVPVTTPQVTTQPSTIPQVNYIDPSVTSPFISPSSVSQIIPFIEPSTAEQIFYPVPVPQIFTTYITPQIIYPQTLPETIQPQKVQQTSKFISPQTISPQKVQTVNPVLKSPQPTQKAIEVSTAPSTIFIKEYNEAVPVTTSVSSNISDNKYIFANSLNQNEETPVQVPIFAK